MRDVFGNHVAIARFSDRAAELRFESTIRLDHSPAGIAEADIEDFARTYPFVYQAGKRPGLAQFIERQSLDPHHQSTSGPPFLAKEGSATRVRFSSG